VLVSATSGSGGASAPTTAPAPDAPALSTPGGTPAQRTTTELKRTSVLGKIRYRIRRRNRFEVRVAGRETVRLVDRTGGLDSRSTDEEALRTLRRRSLDVLTWNDAHRDARSGVLCSHSTTCPPPERS